MHKVLFYVLSSERAYTGSNSVEPPQNATQKEPRESRGKPGILFFLPDAYGTRDYKVEYDHNYILYCLQAYGQSRPIHGCSEEFIDK